MNAVLGFLVIWALILLVNWLLIVLARGKAGRQVAAVDQAKEAGEPVSCDVGAYLLAGKPGWSGWWSRRAHYGVLHIRPASLSWESRSQHRHATRDLSAATLIDETGPPGPLGYGHLDYVAQYRLTLRCGDETLVILVRRPLAQLVKAGLEQVARAEPTAEGSSQP